MEVGDVAGEQRGSVARGIDGDEERLHLRRRGAQGVQRRGQLGKLGRADVGTGGVAEVDQQEAAAEVLLGDRAAVMVDEREGTRSEEHTSELQSLMRISYAVFCLQKKNTNGQQNKKLSKLNTRDNHWTT